LDRQLSQHPDPVTPPRQQHPDPVTPPREPAEPPPPPPTPQAQLPAIEEEWCPACPMPSPTTDVLDTAIAMLGAFTLGAAVASLWAYSISKRVEAI